jgi:hypothetical protein
MPVRPGIFTYGGWTALSVLSLVLFGWAPECHGGEDRLDVVLVMDNSTSMARSDSDFVMLAGADLVVSLLRPGDRVHLVSAAAGASIVLSGTGEDRDKFREALSRLHREASVSDHLSVLKLLAAHYGKPEVASRQPLVFWFSGRRFTYDVNNADYYATQEQREILARVQESKAFAEDPLRSKAFRSIQPQVMETIGVLLAEQARRLEALGVPVNVVLAGEGYEAPLGSGEEMTGVVESAVETTGGKLIRAGGGGAGALADVLSRFVARVNAPTQTVGSTEMGSQGESFEVFRGCRHLWVVLLFGRPPLDMGFVAEDVASKVTKPWPFGKPPSDVYEVKPHLQKGFEYKQKRWYRLPESPAGYAVYSVHDPLPGNYRIRVNFERGVPFVLRIVQDVDLVYGFLEEPPESIPLGMEFSSVAALKHPEGYTYVFNRDFVDDLSFKVLMRKIDGTLPDWGKVQVLEPSREGETSFTFSPDSAGTYFLKGKVSHAGGEFVAYMKPHRLDVHPRIPLRFEPVTLTWRSPDVEGWTEIEPPLALAEGVEIPEDVEFEIHVDAAGITGHQNLELDPYPSFTVSRDDARVRFRVRYVDAESIRLKGGRFEGSLRLRVDGSQRQIVQGSGVWDIPVRGRVSSMGMSHLHAEYGVFVYLGIALVVIALLVVERVTRPSFDRDFVFESREVIGPKERNHRLPAGRIFKPPLPFVRQRIVVGRGGDVGLYREDVLCVIVPTRKGFDVLPRSAVIVYEDDSGDVIEMGEPFAGTLERQYRVRGDSGKIRFWFVRDGEPDRRERRSR